MSDFDLVVRGNIVERDRIITDGWVAVREGRVAARGIGAAPSAREYVDARGMWAMPGVLDGQVHSGSQANQEGPPVRPSPAHPDRSGALRQPGQSGRAGLGLTGGGSRWRHHHGGNAL